jgi:hypothetical protein
MIITVTVVLDTEVGAVEARGEDKDIFIRWIQNRFGELKQEGRQEVLDNIYRSIQKIAQ